ncbi:serine hydroxymethyltransferase [Salpingoeca rosetta]|uniref:Serine hydroxymethyltransferase n=1 Tax=Salpingoeca rosetta (strain ATCC 50818 / BSB-021) TaxID=946362 RepID=F2UCG6_SALR5|nr:serine hydroxymethyltransferase [Salpingoeca rosetta]EGD74273.1 serine hydroxymethyltransferase [Salpingoeca rosetta]|eukprot:XP_004993173.1 serine hydroxymethyltransferase [Salpingoeca rosetta]
MPGPTTAAISLFSRSLFRASVSCSARWFRRRLSTTTTATTTMSDIPKTLPGQTPLKDHDPDLFEMIQHEKERQRSGLELIASENFTSRAVNDCLGSCLTNKYSEGLPGARYYGGQQFIDKIENLCRDRALQAFRLSPEQWGVNVQPYSGSPANLAVYTALLNPHDRIMGLDLPSGGHLTHGYYSYNARDGTTKKISATSVFFESLPYCVSAETGLIDYVELQKRVDVFKPKLIICGGSAYPRDWDYKRFREIADTCGAYLMCDMAHISGLVAAQEANDPFEYCDVVTSTTHKSLRGPRAGIIFFKKELEAKINFAVFPMLQGGPHEHQIAGVATQLKEVMTPEFKQYIQQVKKNTRALADALTGMGHVLATGGSDNHLILWDLRPHGITGSKMEKVCDKAEITLNKNAILGDRSALAPGAVRIGTPALTTRGFKEEHFRQVAEFLNRALKIAIDVQNEHGKPLKTFIPALEGNAEIEQLHKDVAAFARQFPLPGGDY